MIKLFATVIQTRTTNLYACFICVLSTGMIMAAVIQFLPTSAWPAEYTQFGVAVIASSVVYHVFLNANIVKSIFLAMTNFLLQILTLLGFTLAASIAQAQPLFG